MGGGSAGNLVEVHLGGQLSWYDPEKRSRFTVRLDVSLRVADLIAELGIPAAEVAVAAINGERVDVNTAIVADADRLDLFPPIGGG